MWSEGRSTRSFLERDGEVTDHRPEAGDEPGPGSADHEQADDDQQHTPDDVDDADVALDPRDRAADPAEAEGDQQEGHAEPDAIEESDESGAGDVAAVDGEEPDGREGRADARRPADREDDAEQRGADQAGARLPLRLDRALEERDLPDEDEAHQDDERPTDAQQQIAVLDEEHSERAREHEEHHEHDGEPGDEEGRTGDHATT